MRQTKTRVCRALLCVVIASLVVACAKEDISPVDSEQQAACLENVSGIAFHRDT
jgi:hypothetical protein